MKRGDAFDARTLQCDNPGLGGIMKISQPWGLLFDACSAVESASMCQHVPESGNIPLQQSLTQFFLRVLGGQSAVFGLEMACSAIRWRHAPYVSFRQF